jgi:hypothetical protein
MMRHRFDNWTQTLSNALRARRAAGLLALAAGVAVLSRCLRWSFPERPWRLRRDAHRPGPRAGGRGRTSEGGGSPGTSSPRERSGHAHPHRGGHRTGARALRGAEPAGGGSPGSLGGDPGHRDPWRPGGCRRADRGCGERLRGTRLRLREPAGHFRRGHDLAGRRRDLHASPGYPWRQHPGGRRRPEGPGEDRFRHAELDAVPGGGPGAGPGHRRGHGGRGDRGGGRGGGRASPDPHLLRRRRSGTPPWWRTGTPSWRSWGSRGGTWWSSG